MSTSELQIEELLSKAAARSKKAFRNSMVISVAAILLGGGWLLYSFWKVYDLETKSTALDKQIVEQKGELENVNKELDEKRQLLNNLKPSLLKNIEEASKEVKSNSPSDPKKLAQTPVWYYEKNADDGKVKKALKEIGFNVIVKEPIRADLPSNLVAFGEKANPEDAKLFAFTLIRAGIEIKDICRDQMPARAGVIRILGAEVLLKRPPLTVNEIRNKTTFPTCDKF